MSETVGFAHMVYFTLHDNSEANREQLLAGCKKYLMDHPGLVHFSIGTRAEEMQREVNDDGFHVCLNTVFNTKEDHDAYQVAPRHLQFIEEHKEMWAQVRVFDSHLTEMV